MNYEENRLGTYDTWPQNAPVESFRLARAGFYSTGRFLEVECNWCHSRINDWDYGDDIYERHVMAQPECPFLVQNNNCDNIPIRTNEEVADEAANTTATSREMTSESLHIEANRLATFKNWPNPNISPQSLAKAGFFYLNRSDEVKCAWCKGVIAKWEQNDNAFDEHQRFFPDCPRVQLGPLIELASDGIRDLGIQKITAPKQPKYSSIDARLRTYTAWPIPNIQTPMALAQAGLYSQGINDMVRCFHCNIGLRSWQKEDDPWFEHAKWYPQCQFVHLVKGPNYVKEVEEIVSKSNDNLNVSQLQQSSSGAAMSIDEAMTTAPVLQALEIGLDAGAVRNVTLIQLSNTGMPFATIEDLVKAVFGDPQDESENSNVSTIFEADPFVGRDVVGMPPMCSSYTNLSENIVTPQRNLQTQNEQLSQTADTTQPSSSSSQAKSDAVESTNSNLTCCAEQEPQSPSNDVSLLEEENRKLKDARLCKVCLDEEVGVVFLPCGHLVTCVQCAPGITACPMCRKTIKGFVRTFLS